MESISRADAAAALAALPESAGESALLLLGEHGIGKSHLLASVHALSTTPTVLVRAHPAEWRFPLAGFASVYAAISQQPNPDSHRHFSLRSGEPEALFAAGHDLLELIRGLQLPPTMVLIDDLDRMDQASRVVLGTIAARLAGTSLWIGATASDAEAMEHVSGFATARLLPLTTDEIIEGTTTERELSDSTLQILATYASGNPRVLAEQVATLHDDQSRGTSPVALPPRITPTVEQLTTPGLEALGATARDILQLMALAPLAHVGALASVLPDSADDIEDLVDDGLLTRRGPYVRFTDQRLRSRLYWDQSSRSRRSHHATLGQAYEAHDERLATWHQSSTTRGPQSVDPLLAAAISLVDESRVWCAVEFAERALARAEHLENHAALIIRLCSHLLRNGHLVLADRYSAYAHADPRAPEQSMDILNIRLLARLFNKEHLSDDELSTLADLHADASPEGASSMLCLGAAYRSERWETEDARRLVNQALTLADRVPPSMRLKMLAMRDVVDGLEGVPVAATTSTEALDNYATADPDLLLLRARAMTVREAYSDARQLFTVIMNQPRGRDALRHDLATYGTIRNEINATEFWLARAAVDTWEGRVPSLTRGTSAFAYLQAWYAYSLGEVDKAEEVIDKAMELASLESSQALRARALALRGALHVLTGDIEAAVMDLRQVSAAAIRFRSPTLLRHWADYTEVCLLTGRVQEATATVRALEHRLVSYRSRWGDLALMRCRALVEPGTTSLALLEAAVKEFGRDELPYERGRTLTCLAFRQDELGMTAESRRTRSSAVAAFETAGADGWAAKTGQLLSKPAAAAADTDGARVLRGLSQDERDVAVRVVRGLRNREIAQELFVSVRTVELRLTHIYRSLGIHSRAQLVAALTRKGSSAGRGSGDPSQ